MFDLESFKSYLEDLGINSKESGESLAVENCPECGRNKHKVIFRVVDVEEGEPFFGRCQSGSCRQNYSSISYLLKQGCDRSTVMQLHGKDGRKAMGELDPHNSNHKESHSKNAAQVSTIVDISDFFDLDDNPEHPVCRYALKRGYHKNLSEFIKMDVDKDAVVFVSRGNTGKVLGYQRRFIMPGNGPKTKTSDGFKSSDNIFRLPHMGDYVICEGPFTAVSAWRWGFDAIATFGSGAGKKQLDLIASIHKESPKDIYVAEESDKAGRKFFRKISNHFFMEGIDVHKITPESGDDLNDAWMSGDGYRIDKNQGTNPAFPGNFMEMS